jgi:hypothetical protein
MGQIFADIQLLNPSDELIQPVKVNALVDTGLLFLCIPEHVAIQLSVKQHDIREVPMADGSRKCVPYVGPVRVNPENPNLNATFVGRHFFQMEGAICES